MRDQDPSVATPGGDEEVECPCSGSTATDREHPTGSALCRSMHFCHACEQAFERFG